MTTPKYGGFASALSESMAIDVEDEDDSSLKSKTTRHRPPPTWQAHDATGRTMWPARSRRQSMLESIMNSSRLVVVQQQSRRTTTARQPKTQPIMIRRPLPRAALGAISASVDSYARLTSATSSERAGPRLTQTRARIRVMAG